MPAQPGVPCSNRVPSRRPWSVIAEPGAAEAATLHRDDVSILQFALVLEQLQAAFYTGAERAGALHGKTADLARVVGSA